MKVLFGTGFSLLVFLAAAYAFSPRTLPTFPETTIRAESLLLLDAARAGARLVTVGEHGYVFTSDDNGKTWRQASAPTDSTLTALYFYDAKHGWAVGHNTVILRTEDGGANWQQVYFAPDEQKPLLDVWFNDELRGYAMGAYGSFYGSVDGGRTWQPKKILDSDTHINSLAKVSDGTLFIAGEAGMLLRSHDVGESWERLTSPYKGSFFGVLGLKKGGLLAYGLRGKIFHSADSGRTWEAIETGSEASLMGGKVLEDGAVVLVGLDGTILVSRDDGKSFKLRKRADGKAIAAVASSNNEELLLFGESGVSPVTPLPPQ